MSKTKLQGAEPADFYELAEGQLPTIPWFPRTDNMAERIAALIAEKRFLMKYDEASAPVIDAAVLRNPYLEEDDLAAFLHCLGDGEYIILLDSKNHSPVLADLIGEGAEAELNNLLRFAAFDYRRYMLYLGAAYAITKAEHPEWIYETFIECFRKDVADRISDRTEQYLGYNEFGRGDQ